MKLKDIVVNGVYVAQNKKTLIVIKVDSITEAGTISVTNLTNSQGYILKADEVLYEPLKPITVARILTISSAIRSPI